MSISDKIRIMKKHLNTIKEDSSANDENFDFWMKKISEGIVEEDENKIHQGYKNLVFTALKYKKYDQANKFLDSYKKQAKSADDDWKYRYSVQLYSNSPRFFLDYPIELLKYLDPLANSDNLIEKEKTAKILMTYISIYENIYIVKKKSSQSIQMFFNFVDQILPISEKISKHLQYRIQMFKRLIDEELTFEIYTELIDKHLNELNPTDEDALENIIKKSKILVVGQPVVNLDDLYKVVNELGYIVDNVEFHTDYDKLKNLDITRFKNTEKYQGIVVGPIAHQIKGMNYDDVIAKTLSDQSQNYPFWKKCITESGEFKITRSSFYRALKDIRLNQEGSII